MTTGKIYNCDLRWIEFEDGLIITDLPYNIGYNYLEYADTLDRSEYMDLFKGMVGKRVVIIHYPEETIRDIVPVLGPPLKTVSWVYNSNTARQHRMISWYNCKPDLSKVKQPYKNTTDKRIIERIKNGSEGAALYDWWEIDIVKNTSSEKTEYTNQIPEELLARIIKTTAKDGEIIIDPFCGSGSTLAAAKKLGFDYRGCDQSAKAVEIARRRVEQQITMF